MCTLFAARAEIIDDFVLRFSRRNVQRPIEPDFGRKMREETFEGFDAKRGQHLAALDIGFRQIAHEGNSRNR